MGKNKVRSSIYWLAGACLLIFLFRIPGLYQHILDIDETVFSEFARIMMQGGVPYVDAVDNKPPLTYFFFLINHVIWNSQGLLFVHFTTIIWVCLTAAALYRLAGKIIPAAAGPAVMIFAFLMHTYEPKYISTNGETLINLPLVLSVLLYIGPPATDRKSVLRYMISGILLGTALMINYKAGFLAIAYIIYSLVAEPLMSREGRLSVFINNSVRLAVTGFSSLVPVIITGLCFYKQGNFGEAFFWGFTYNFGYIKSGSGTFSLMKISARVFLFVFLSLPVWIAAGRYVKKIVRPGSGMPGSALTGSVFVLIWLAASFYAVTLGGRGYGHYFIQLAPPLAAAGGLAFCSVRPGKGLFWAWLAVPVVLLTCARADMIRSYELVNYPNYRSQISFESAGNYVSERTGPEDRIYVWGWATPVYYFADRRSASRFLISDFVSGRIFGTSNRSEALRKGMGDEFLPILMEDLRRNRPVYFIDTSPSDYFGYGRFPLHKYPELYKLISDKYKRETEIDGMVIYRLKD